MKKVLKFIGATAGAAAFALSLSACGNSETPEQQSERIENEKVQYFSNLEEGLTNSLKLNAEINFAYAGAEAKITVKDVSKTTDADGKVVLTAQLSVVSNGNDMGVVTVVYKDEIFYINETGSIYTSEYVKGSDGFYTEVETKAGEGTMNVRMPLGLLKSALVMTVTDALESEMDMAGTEASFYAEKILDTVLGASVDEDTVKVSVRKLFENLKAETKDGVTTYTVDEDALKAHVTAAVTEVFAFTKKDINGMLLEITDNQVSCESLASDIAGLKDKSVNDGLDYLKEKSGYSLTELIEKVNSYVKNDYAALLKDNIPEDEYNEIKANLEDFDLNAYALAALTEAGLDVGDATTLEAYIRTNYGTVTVSQAIEMACSASGMTTIQLNTMLGQYVVTLGGTYSIADANNTLALVGDMLLAVADVKPVALAYDYAMTTPASEVLSVFGTDYDTFCTNVTELVDAIVADFTEDFDFACAVKEDGTPVSLSFDFDVDVKDYAEDVLALYNKTAEEKVTELEETPVVSGSFSIDYSSTATTYDFDEFVKNFAEESVSQGDLNEWLREAAELDDSVTLTGTMEDSAYVVSFTTDECSYVVTFGGFYTDSEKYTVEGETDRTDAFLMYTVVATYTDGDVEEDFGTIDLEVVTNTDGTVTYKLPDAE